MNWENPEVREEVYKNINWWLDKGLGGFRIDAIINIKKKLPYQDYPSDRADGLSDMSLMLADAKGLGEFLGEMNRRTFQPHDSFAVRRNYLTKGRRTTVLSETMDIFPLFLILPQLPGARMIKLVCQWAYCSDAYKQCYFHSPEKIGDVGFYSNIIENHDEFIQAGYYISRRFVRRKQEDAGCAVFLYERTAFYLSGTGNRYGKPGCDSH